MSKTNAFSKVSRRKVDEAERQWFLHANEVLAANEEYVAAEREQRHVGRVVALAYVVLVAGLLAFMVGFYLWRFRFFWAIVIYVVLISICAVAAHTISVHAVRNDHLGELVRKAHDEYVANLRQKKE